MKRTLLLLFGCISWLVESASAQGASAYVTLGDWMAPSVEYLIQLGVINDPSPLSRPFRRADVVEVLRSADTTGLPVAVARTIRRLHTELGIDDGRPAFGIHAYAGGSVGTHARRESLREAGDGGISPHGGAAADAVLGPIVMSTRYHVESRLKHDPDYTGVKSPTGGTPMMFTDAYVGVQGAYGQLVFGAVSRNWGPSGVPGLVVSAEPYPYDHLFLSLGTNRVRLDALATELDSHLNDQGERVRRFWGTSRLLVSPVDWLTFTLVQASLWSGVGRGLEPWFVNPLKWSSMVRSDENEPDSLNSMVAGSVHLKLPRGAVLQASLMIDDLASLIGSSGAPDRMGATAVADVPLSSLATLRLSGLLVSSLTYRSPGGMDQSIMRRGVGIGHNYADYVQFTASVSLLPLPMTVLKPHVSLLYQGEGDFRSAFPVSWGDHPYLFEGNVERTLRAGAKFSTVLLRGLNFDGDAAIHFVRNSGHVVGATQSKFVGRLFATYRIGVRGFLQ